MKTYHFAVDLGATSGRTILACFDGNKIEMTELTRFRNLMLPIAGHLHWNLPELYSQILTGLKKACNTLGDNARLSSIGIDTWGCDIAYFNSSGGISNLPYCYRDAHTEGAVEEYCRIIPKKSLYEMTGIQFMDFNTLFQLSTIRKNNPEILDNTTRIAFIPDALSYMLTGNLVTEYTIASTSQLLNPKTGELDEELLDTISVSREKFGKLVTPGVVIGSLTPQVQEYTGLGVVPVIAVAGHDTASAVIAVPTPDNNYAYLSCGTWSLLGIESRDEIINEGSYDNNFTNEGGFDGSIRFLKNICGLWLFEQCRSEWSLDEAPVDNVEKLASLCEKSECDIIINPDSPLFAHPASMTEAIREYCLSNNLESPVSPSDFVRVIFRSLANRYKEIISILRSITDHKINRLHVIGGGSCNKYLMQMTADATGIPVVAGPSECTALGNVLVQLYACKKVANIEEMREISIKSTETITYLPKQ